MNKEDLEFIIIHGYLTEGFGFIGPFNSYKDAADYIADDRDLQHGNVMISLLQKPYLSVEEDETKD